MTRLGWRTLNSKRRALERAPAALVNSFGARRPVDEIGRSARNASGASRQACRSRWMDGRRRRDERRRFEPHGGRRRPRRFASRPRFSAPFEAGEIAFGAAAFSQTPHISARTFTDLRGEEEPRPALRARRAPALSLRDPQTLPSTTPVASLMRQTSGRCPQKAGLTNIERAISLASATDVARSTTPPMSEGCSSPATETNSKRHNIDALTPVSRCDLGNWRIRNRSSQRSPEIGDFAALSGQPVDKGHSFSPMSE